MVETSVPLETAEVGGHAPEVERAQSPSPPSLPRRSPTRRASDSSFATSRDTTTIDLWRIPSFSPRPVWEEEEEAPVPHDSEVVPLVPEPLSFDDGEAPVPQAFEYVSSSPEPLPTELGFKFESPGPDSPPTISTPSTAARRSSGTPPSRSLSPRARTNMPGRASASPSLGRRRRDGSSSSSRARPHTPSDTQEVQRQEKEEEDGELDGEHPAKRMRTEQGDVGPFSVSACVTPQSDFDGGQPPSASPSTRASLSRPEINMLLRQLLASGRISTASMRRDEVGDFDITTLSFAEQRREIFAAGNVPATPTPRPALTPLPAPPTRPTPPTRPSSSRSETSRLLRQLVASGRMNDRDDELELTTLSFAEQRREIFAAADVPMDDSARSQASPTAQLAITDVAQQIEQDELMAMSLMYGDEAEAKQETDEEMARRLCEEWNGTGASKAKKVSAPTPDARRRPLASSLLRGLEGTPDDLVDPGLRRRRDRKRLSPLPIERRRPAPRPARPLRFGDDLDDPPEIPSEEAEREEQWRKREAAYRREWQDNESSAIPSVPLPTSPTFRQPDRLDTDDEDGDDKKGKKKEDKRPVEKGEDAKEEDEE